MSEGDSALAGSDLEIDRLGLIARVAEVGVWDWDLVSNTIVYSPRAKAIIGLAPSDEVTLDYVRSLTHPEDVAYTRDLSRRALDPALRERGRYEYRLLLPDGTVRWVVAHGEAEFATVDGVERAIRYIGALQDVTEARRLALAEQRANDRLRLAIEASRMAVWDYDVAAQAVSGSPELNRLMGFPVDANPTIAELQATYLPGEAESVSAQVRASLQAGETAIEAEFQNQGPDGVRRWLLLRAEVELDGRGAPARFVGVLMDITDRKLADQALRDSEARFRVMADSAPSPVWVTSVDGDIEFVNEAFAEYAGRPRETLVGEVWMSLLHPGDLAQVVQARAAARQGPEPYSFEARFRHADGRYRWMLANSKPRFDTDGAFQGYVGIAVDLTEQRMAQEALQESEERFRLMAEGAPVMLWLGDEVGGCVYLNRALREFWGVAEDLNGFTWAATVLPDDIAPLFDAFEVAMARQEAFEVEARYYRADGAVRTLLTRAEPRRDAAGRFLGMHGVNMDVTDIRVAAAKQRLLINELNHRVKNTLASVQSMVRQSLRPGTAIEPARDTLVDRLMALSKAHDVLTQADWEHAELSAIVREAIAPFEDATSPRFVIEGGEVRLDPNAALAVSMALHELATNAVKYGALSALQGQVRLHWACEDGRVRLTWREVGGPPVVPPTRKGFGTRLLRSDLAGSANLDFAPTGLVAVFVARIAAL